jgi:hypothetical protein
MGPDKIDVRGEALLTFSSAASASNTFSSSASVTVSGSVGGAVVSSPSAAASSSAEEGELSLSAQQKPQTQASNANPLS